MKRPDGTAVPIVKGTSQYLSYEFDEVGTYVLTTVNTDKTGKEVYNCHQKPKAERSYQEQKEKEKFQQKR